MDSSKRNSSNIKTQLYLMWIENHFDFTLKRSSWFGAASICFVVFVETLLFKNTMMLYAPLQLGCALFFALVLMATTRTGRSITYAFKKTEFVLWMPHVFISLAYIYFLQIAPTNDRQIVQTGTFLVILFTQIALHDYARSSGILFSVTSLALATQFIRNNDPTIRHSLVLSFIVAGISWFLASWIRREFKNSMFERYSILRNMLPPKEALMASIVQDDGEFFKLFAPKMRPNVCLCSDWRGYQKLASKLDAETLSRNTDRFYELVMTELERIDPNGTYCARWVADQLFVIFYDENDISDYAIERALQFTEAFCGKVFDTARSQLFPDILFDVGLASGVGLLGLQGAKGIMLTTVTAEHAGFSNRLEREAKNLRKNAPQKSRPFVCVDEEIKNYISSTYAPGSLIEPLLLSEDDLKGHSYFKWNYPEQEFKFAKFNKDEFNQHSNNTLQSLKSKS